MTLMISLSWVTFTDSRREMDKCPVCMQVQRSHMVASMHRWWMFVRCTSLANAAARREIWTYEYVICVRQVEAVGLYGV